MLKSKLQNGNSDVRERSFKGAEVDVYTYKALSVVLINNTLIEYRSSVLLINNTLNEYR